MFIFFPVSGSNKKKMWLYPTTTPVVVEKREHEESLDSDMSMFPDAFDTPDPASMSVTRSPPPHLIYEDDFQVKAELKRFAANQKTSICGSESAMFPGMICITFRCFDESNECSYVQKTCSMCKCVREPVAQNIAGTRFVPNSYGTLWAKPVPLEDKLALPCGDDGMGLPNVKQEARETSSPLASYDSTVSQSFPMSLDKEEGEGEEQEDTKESNRRGNVTKQQRNKKLKNAELLRLITVACKIIESHKNTVKRKSTASRLDPTVYPDTIKDVVFLQANNFAHVLVPIWLSDKRRWSCLERDLSVLMLNLIYLCCLSNDISFSESEFLHRLDVQMPSKARDKLHATWPRVVNTLYKSGNYPSLDFHNLARNSLRWVCCKLQIREFEDTLNMYLSSVLAWENFKRVKKGNGGGFEVKKEPQVFIKAPNFNVANRHRSWTVPVIVVFKIALEIEERLASHRTDLLARVQEVLEKCSNEEVKKYTKLACQNPEFMSLIKQRSEVCGNSISKSMKRRFHLFLKDQQKQQQQTQQSEVSVKVSENPKPPTPLPSKETQPQVYMRDKSHHLVSRQRSDTRKRRRNSKENLLLIGSSGSPTLTLPIAPQPESLFLF